MPGILRWVSTLKWIMKSPSEPSLYINTQGQDLLILCLYVDDLIYNGTNQRMIEDLKKAMLAEFEATDLGLMKYFLGMKVKQKRRSNLCLLRKICRRTPKEV